MVDEVKLKKLAQDFVMAARNGLKNRDGEFTFVVLPDEEESKILIDQFGRLEESEMFYNYRRNLSAIIGSGILFCLIFIVLSKIYYSTVTFSP